MVVSIEGHCQLPPSPPQTHSSVSPHPTPGRKEGGAGGDGWEGETNPTPGRKEGGAGGDGWEGETISAEELDEKLREQMESKALEW